MNNINVPQKFCLFDSISKCDKVFYYVQFFIMGLITNFGSILILTGAQNLSKQMDMNHLLGLYTFSVIICSSITRIINSRCCLRVSYMKRVFGLSFYLLLGYLSLFTVLSFIDSLDKTLVFFLTLIPSFIMGTGFAFGETTVLGYLRMFPKDLVAGWGSGIGCAGIIAATLNLIVKVNEIKLRYLYLAVSPITMVYMLNFYIITIRFEKHKLKGIVILKSLLGTEEDNDSNNQQPLVESDNQQALSLLNISNTADNKILTCTNGKEAFVAAYRLIINLACVHFMECTTLNGLSERITHKDYIDDPFFKKCMFEAFCICFQLGHFIARSSLVVVKHITFVETFFICQVIVALLWIFEYYYGYMTTVYILFTILVILGIMGGSTYVASFYFILNSDHIESNIKELCVNMATIANDIGTLCSSLAVLLIDNVIMKED